MNFRIDTTQSGHRVSISGRIDTLTARELEDAILPLVTDACPSLSLHCEQVEYISSTGLRVFILASKKTRHCNGTITITGLTAFLKDIFDVTGLTDLFEFN